MSSLYRRGRIYWLSFRKYGKAYCKSLKTKDRSTALYRKAEIDRKLAEGVYEIPTQDADCRKAFEDYMAFHEHRRTRRVNAGVRSRIERFLSWSAAVRFNQISPLKFQEYLNMRMAGDCGVSAYEANNAIIALKGWLNWCVLNGIISVNPLRTVKKIETPEATRRFLTKGQITELLKAAKDKDLYVDHEATLLPVLATAIYAGLRKAELFSLEWPDIDFARGVINVRNKKDAFQTKSKKNRTIPLHPDLRRILKPLRLKEGRCFDVTNYRRIFGRICKKAGLADLKIHELRHTFASQSLMAGVPVTTVSKWLGHASLTTTQIYSHLCKTHEKEEIEKLRF